MVLALALSVLIGVTLGLLGGGGAILTVPMLVYVLGVEPKRAMATSLVVVCVTSLAAVVPHARAGRVRWRTALIFGPASMAGAFAGGRVARLVPSSILLTAFALVMLASAFAMTRGRKESPRDADARAQAASNLPMLKILGTGALVGAVTGMVGAGGGFLVVPALVLLGRLPMCVAVGTSLVVIVMNTSAAFTGYLGHVTIDARLAGLITAAAVSGSVAGSLVAGRVPQAALRKAFACLVMAMALYIVCRQLPPEIVAARWPLFVAGGAAVIAVLVLLPDRVSGGASPRAAPRLPRTPAGPPGAPAR
jgi:uncharacterized membrane protein YfcA